MVNELVNVVSIVTAVEEKCSCHDSWLHHWYEYLALKNRLDLPEISFVKCANEGCNNKAEVGAHIHAERYGKAAYIVPLCYNCHNRQGRNSFEIPEDYLVYIQ